jgi:hypothetical protein
MTERDDTLTLLTDTVLSQDVMSLSVLLAFWLASAEIPAASRDVLAGSDVRPRSTVYCEE